MVKDWVVLIMYSLVTLCCIVGMITNCVTFSILLRSKMRRKTPYIFLIGLAIADGLHLFIKLPHAITNLLHAADISDCWSKPQILYTCFVETGLGYACAAISTWIVTTVAFDRYMFTNRVRHVHIRVPWKVWRTLGIITILCLLLYVPMWFICRPSRPYKTCPEALGNQLWTDEVPLDQFITDELVLAHPENRYFSNVTRDISYKTCKYFFQNTDFFESQVYLVYTTIRMCAAWFVPLTLTAVFNFLLLHRFRSSRRKVASFIPNSADTDVTAITKHSDEIIPDLRKKRLTHRASDPIVSTMRKRNICSTFTLQPQNMTKSKVSAQDSLSIARAERRLTAMLLAVIFQCLILNGVAAIAHFTVTRIRNVWENNELYNYTVALIDVAESLSASLNIVMYFLLNKTFVKEVSTLCTCRVKLKPKRPKPLARAKPVGHFITGTTGTCLLTPVIRINIKNACTTVSKIVESESKCSIATHRSDQMLILSVSQLVQSTEEAAVRNVEK